MYRFSLAESADPRGYVVAGAHAGADALGIQQALDQSTPDYAGLNTVGRELAARKRVSDSKADLDRDLAKMGTKEYGSVRSLNEQQTKANNTKRFAGKLAYAGLLARELNRKEYEPTPPKRMDYSGLENYLDSLRIRAEEADAAAKNLPQPEQLPDIPKPSILNGESSPDGEVSMNPSSPNSSTAARYALKQTIRFVEGTLGPDGYRTMFGGGLFDDTSKHPARVQFGAGGRLSSAAAGAYQFLPKTWNMVGSNIDLPDFDVDSQERAADWLLNYRKVNADIPLTDLNSATAVFDKLSPEWAGFPYKGQKSFHEGQGQYTAQEVYDFYKTALQAAQLAGYK